MLPTNLFTVIIVTAGIVAVVYLLDSLYARRWLTIGKGAISYIAAAILIGVFGEVFVETLYNAAFGQPLWYYQFLPVHSSYTSQFSVILWAMYGLHLYWAKQTLDKKFGKLPKWKLASIFAVESLLLETFANLVWLGAFGYLIYFYTPGDLWHVTTLVNIPCYFGAAWAMLSTVRRFNRDPRFYAAMSALIVAVFLWFP